MAPSQEPSRRSTQAARGVAGAWPQTVAFGEIPAPILAPSQRRPVGAEVADGFGGRLIPGPRLRLCCAPKLKHALVWAADPPQFPPPPPSFTFSIFNSTPPTSPSRSLPRKNQHHGLRHTSLAARNHSSVHRRRFRPLPARAGAPTHFPRAPLSSLRGHLAYFQRLSSKSALSPNPQREA